MPADYFFNVSLSTSEKNICQVLICMCYSVGLNSWVIFYYSDDWEQHIKMSPPGMH